MSAVTAEISIGIDDDAASTVDSHMHAESKGPSTQRTLYTLKEDHPAEAPVVAASVHCAGRWPAIVWTPSCAL